MTVLITMKVKGDTEKFQRALGERADEFAAISERAKPAGAVHHQFGMGDDYVLAVDEWESAAQFEKFFADPDLQAFIASVGGDSNTAPDITVTEAIDSPDKF